MQSAPGGDQRLLQLVLGILERTEDSVAVQLQLPPVRVDQLAEGGFVAGAGADERVSAHQT